MKLINEFAVFAGTPPVRLCYLPEILQNAQDEVFRAMPSDRYISSGGIGWREMRVGYTASQNTMSDFLNLKIFC